MHTYTALLHPVRNHYRVDFPDFPGLHGSAISLDMVRPLAEAILADHLESVRAQTGDLPEPLSMREALDGDLHAIALPISIEPRAGADLHTHIGQSAAAA